MDQLTILLKMGNVYLKHCTGYLNTSGALLPHFNHEISIKNVIFRCDT